MSSQDLGKFLNNYHFCVNCECSNCSVPKKYCGIEDLSCNICITNWLEGESNINEKE